MGLRLLLVAGMPDDFHNLALDGEWVEEGGEQARNIQRRGGGVGSIDQTWLGAYWTPKRGEWSGWTWQRTRGLVG